MARPKISTKERRTEYFSFRVTKAQRDTLLSLAESAGRTPGDIIREKLFSGRFPNPKLARIDQAAYSELKKIGVNINQLVKHANSGKFPYGIRESLIDLKRQEHHLLKLLLTYDSLAKDRQKLYGCLKV